MLGEASRPQVLPSLHKHCPSPTSCCPQAPQAHCKRWVASPWHAALLQVSPPPPQQCPTSSITIPTSLAKQSRVMLPTKPSRFPLRGFGTNEEAHGSPLPCLCAHRTPSCLRPERWRWTPPPRATWHGSISNSKSTITQQTKTIRRKQASSLGKKALAELQAEQIQDVLDLDSKKNHLSGLLLPPLAAGGLGWLPAHSPTEQG